MKLKNAERDLSISKVHTSYVSDLAFNVKEDMNWYGFVVLSLLDEVILGDISNEDLLGLSMQVKFDDLCSGLGESSSYLDIYAVSCYLRGGGYMG